MDTKLFDYHLPRSLIAQEPVRPRRRCRLLVIDRADGSICHRAFEELPDLLCSGDRLVFNDTKVLPARLLGEKQGTGGRVEVFLLERIVGRRWRCLVRPGSRLRPGQVVVFPGHEEYCAIVGERLEDGARDVEFRGTGRFDRWLALAGVMPLPPYIRRAAGAVDDREYQTIFACHPGAVAAPTAGLHFDRAMLRRLDAAGIERSTITLHVGIGTFRPIQAEQIEDHRLHGERFEIPADSVRAIGGAAQRGGRIVAVGTTVVRTLEHLALASGESLEAWNDGVIDERLLSGTVDLYIRPGHRFGAIDVMLTNFHLPRSSLLVLVAAFAGRELVMEAYAEAVRERYRFYSYGDAMLIL